MAVALGSAVRMIWQDSNQAIGETYYNTGTPNLDPGSGLYPLALALFKARSLLMGYGVVPVSIRMSTVGVRRAFTKVSSSDVSAVPVGQQSINVNSLPAVLAAGGANTVDGSAAQGPDAVQYDAYGSLATSHARKFLAGCPAVLVRTSPQGPWTVGDPNWLNLFNAYVQVLKTAANGWVMRVRTFPTVPAAPPIPVYALDQTNTNLTVTVPTLPGTINNGTILQILGARMQSRAYKAPNGQWRVINVGVPSGGATTYTLQLPFANNFPFLLSGFGTVQVVSYMADTYVAAFPSKEGQHKRGNRVLAPLGRRRVAQQVS
jgi:hypothetical protein